VTRARETLSSFELGALIGAGAAIVLLLLIFCVVVLLVVSRRRRLAKATYKSDAHDNPTYMRHVDINANLDGGGGSPIDVVFDSDGAIGVTFYADYEKKKVCAF